MTGPALDLAKQLVESWNKPKFKQYSWDKELIDLRLLWEHCGNREKFLDTILEKLNAPNSVFGEIKPVIHLPKLWIECENNQDKFMAKLRELGLQDSVFGQVKPLAEVEGEPSYESPAVQKAHVDPAHPDYKGDLGAVQKQNPTKWVLHSFWISSTDQLNPVLGDFPYPLYVVGTDHNGASSLKTWLPENMHVTDFFPKWFGLKSGSPVSQPIFGPDFPKPDWWEG